MNHNPATFTLDVNMPPVSSDPFNGTLADIKKKTFRSRLLSALFGDRHEILIIMPSGTVRNVTFTRGEAPADGQAASQSPLSKSEGSEVNNCEM